MNNSIEDITILGGGASGICVGYYAKKAGLKFIILEATDAAGGNAVTIHYKDFRFDSGAHRWHDKYPDITKELKNMMGQDLERINVSSHIFHDGKLVNFPLSPLDLLKKLGLSAFMKSGFEVLGGRILKTSIKNNFDDFAIASYGRTIADMFLTNYSEKLWGLPCKELSQHSAGERLDGLNLRALIIEAFCRRKTRARHLDGSFYYPKYGIGEITGKWAEACGHENIRTRSRITKIFHNHDKIQALEINGEKTINTHYVVNTLPVNLFLNMLTPRPSEDILDIGNTLVYQNVKLVALFLNRSSITKSATIYFPEKNFFFTRLCEPRNRSIDMSPPGRTSLVVEIPCRHNSEFWKMKDTELIERTIEKLVHIGLIREDEIFDACVRYLDYAYPVFHVGFEEKTGRIFNYIDKFKNLTCAGRSGKFEYIHLHNTMKSGKDIVENYKVMNSANRFV